MTSETPTPAEPREAAASGDIEELREARDVLLRAMQDESIVGRRRQRIEDAADGMVRAALAKTPAPPAEEEDAKLDTRLAAYFDDRRAAIRDVVANRASPPEYPGLALVPVSDLERLETFLGVPTPAPRAPVGELDALLLGMAMDLVSDEDARIGVVGRGSYAERVAREYAALSEPRYGETPE